MDGIGMLAEAGCSMSGLPVCCSQGTVGEHNKTYQGWRNFLAFVHKNNAASMNCLTVTITA